MNSFVIADPNKCVGCRTCEIACIVAHSDKNALMSENSDLESYPRLTVIKTAEVTAPVQCRHCEDAPCANVCPNGSIMNKDGVNCVDKETCIGCKTCLVACPFGAVGLVADFNDGKKVVQSGLKCNDSGKLDDKEKMVANKCDLCMGREQGPACVEICPTSALRLVKPSQVKESIKEKRMYSVQDLSHISAK